ncbi:MAG: hypothetical protein ABIO70_19605 [Pseudomonadota bacterium]
MGFWAWLFPGPAERIARARKLLAHGDPGQARLELEGVEGHEAEACRVEVIDTLVSLNLEAAERAAAAGQGEAAAEHLKLAEGFAAPRHADAMRAGRRVVREARTARRAAQAAREERHLGRSSCAGGSCGVRGPVPHEAPSPGFGADPIFSLPPDHPQVRYAMLMEAWPADLRARLLALGPGFATAVLRLEDGDAQGAWESLEPFAAGEPAVRLPRGQAALALGQFARAASELRSFGEAFGHRRVGAFHTAVMLARALASDHRLEEALGVLRDQRATDTDLELAANEVALLEALGRLPEADAAGLALLRQAPGDFGVHRMLARIRIKGGQRVAAMQVLESGLTRLCKGPGKCGSQPLDVESVRMLAQLYLEDRLEPARAEELLQQIAVHARQPAWIDGYLAALLARNRGEPGVAERAQALSKVLPDDDPRHGLVREHLLAALS